MIRDNIVNQLVYSTARIICSNEKWNAYGSGFFMLYEDTDEQKQYLAFVTNKHVVNGYSSARIEMVGADANGNPVDTQHITIQLSDLQKNCIYHPEDDIDICFVFVNSEIEELCEHGEIPYYRCIGNELILRNEDFALLTSVEDVIMIGYPNGIMDNFNCKPVVRKGITATNLKLDYDGKPVFMIDAACFPGSSGSPVFLRKTGLEQETIEGGIRIGVTAAYSLLGILYSGPIIELDGKIVEKDIPTASVPVAEIKSMMNLGYVVKINKAIELFKLIASNSKTNR